MYLCPWTLVPAGCQQGTSATQLHQPWLCMHLPQPSLTDQASTLMLKPHVLSQDWQVSSCTCSVSRSTLLTGTDEHSLMQGAVQGLPVALLGPH